MQIKLAKDIVKHFYFKKRGKIYLITMLSLIASIFEYLGLIFIFQFLLILTNPNSSQVSIVISFFKKCFNIEDFALISLIVGSAIALIYIFKNIYLYCFMKINSSVLQDLSVEMALKITKKLLFCDFVKINSIPNSQKQGLYSKINIVVWEYLNRYIILTTNIAIIIILLAFLFVKFTRPATVAFIFIVILSTIEFLILRHKAQNQKKFFPIYFDALNKVIYTIVNAIKEIRLNNKSSYFLSCAKEKYSNAATLNKKAAADSVFHIYFTEISIMIVFILVLNVLYFSSEFNNKTIILTLGAIIAVILRITPAFNRFQSAIYSIRSNENIALDILDFDNQLSEIPKIKEDSEILPFENKIELKNISYNYPENDLGLENINLKINKGDFIGIVGKSGCYKTTLSLIIAGLIKPQKGEIEIDDMLLTDENIGKWQNNISVLSQDFSIIKDNIFEGLSDEIIKKLELKGLNSNPLELSFGQKQRAALAQIIAQNKKLIILDEATSSMDVISENKINDLLSELKGKVTIISIAHRLQILKHCDKIIYMENGKIVDFATFKELNDRYPQFSKIIELSNFKL